MIRKYKPKHIIDLLEKHEGYREKPYQDSLGNWTFGIGATFITRQQARNLAWEQVVDIEKDLDRDIPWWRSLSRMRELVIISMAFNLGVNGLLRFRKSLAAMQRENWDKAADEMLDSTWAEQVGRRAEELADMMREG